MIEFIPYLIHVLFKIIEQIKVFFDTKTTTNNQKTIKKAIEQHQRSPMHSNSVILFCVLPSSTCCTQKVSELLYLQTFHVFRSQKGPYNKYRKVHQHCSREGKNTSIIDSSANAFFSLKNRYKYIAAVK